MTHAEIVSKIKSAALYEFVTVGSRYEQPGRELKGRAIIEIVPVDDGFKVVLYRRDVPSGSRLLKTPATAANTALKWAARAGIVAGVVA